LLDDVPRHRIQLALVASVNVRGAVLERIDDESPADLDSAFRRVYREVPPIKLERPPRNRIDESFLREVALAYRLAVAAGRSPLKAIAEDSGIPVGTVARWVARARSPEFKILPPAETGKVVT
jgi:hypothetical protein